MKKEPKTSAMLPQTTELRMSVNDRKLDPQTTDAKIFLHLARNQEEGSSFDVKARVYDYSDGIFTKKGKGELLKDVISMYNARDPCPPFATAVRGFPVERKGYILLGVEEGVGQRPAKRMLINMYHDFWEKTRTESDESNDTENINIMELKDTVWDTLLCNNMRPVAARFVRITEEQLGLNSAEFYYIGGMISISYGSIGPARLTVKTKHLSKSIGGKIVPFADLRFSREGSSNRSHSDISDEEWEAIQKQFTLANNHADITATLSIMEKTLAILKNNETGFRVLIVDTTMPIQDLPLIIRECNFNVIIDTSADMQLGNFFRTVAYNNPRRQYFGVMEVKSQKTLSHDNELLSRAANLNDNAALYMRPYHGGVDKKTMRKWFRKKFINLLQAMSQRSSVCVMSIAWGSPSAFERVAILRSHVLSVIEDNEGKIRGDFAVIACHLQTSDLTIERPRWRVEEEDFFCTESTHRILACVKEVDMCGVLRSTWVSHLNNGAPTIPCRSALGFVELSNDLIMNLCANHIMVVPHNHRALLQEKLKQLPDEKQADVCDKIAVSYHTGRGGFVDDFDYELRTPLSLDPFSLARLRKMYSKRIILQRDCMDELTKSVKSRLDVPFVSSPKNVITVLHRWCDGGSTVGMNTLVDLCDKFPSFVVKNVVNQTDIVTQMQNVWNEAYPQKTMLLLFDDWKFEDAKSLHFLLVSKGVQNVCIHIGRETANSTTPQDVQKIFSLSPSELNSFREMYKEYTNSASVKDKIKEQNSLLYLGLVTFMGSKTDEYILMKNYLKKMLSHVPTDHPARSVLKLCAAAAKYRDKSLYYSQKGNHHSNLWLVPYTLPAHILDCTASERKIRSEMCVTVGKNEYDLSTLLRFEPGYVGLVAPRASYDFVKEALWYRLDDTAVADDIANEFWRIVDHEDCVEDWEVNDFASILFVYNPPNISSVRHEKHTPMMKELSDKKKQYKLCADVFIYNPLFRSYYGQYLVDNKEVQDGLKQLNQACDHAFQPKDIYHERDFKVTCTSFLTKSYVRLHREASIHINPLGEELYRQDMSRLSLAKKALDRLVVPSNETIEAHSQHFLNPYIVLPYAEVCIARAEMMVTEEGKREFEDVQLEMEMDDAERWLEKVELIVSGDWGYKGEETWDFRFRELLDRYVNLCQLYGKKRERLSNRRYPKPVSEWLGFTNMEELKSIIDHTPRVSWEHFSKCNALIALNAMRKSELELSLINKRCSLVEIKRVLDSWNDLYEKRFRWRKLGIRSLNMMNGAYWSLLLFQTFSQRPVDYTPSEETSSKVRDYVRSSSRYFDYNIREGSDDSHAVYGICISEEGVGLVHSGRPGVHSKSNSMPSMSDRNIVKYYSFDGRLAVRPNKYATPMWNVVLVNSGYYDRTSTLTDFSVPFTYNYNDIFSKDHIKKSDVEHEREVTFNIFVSYDGLYAGNVLRK